MVTIRLAPQVARKHHSQAAEDHYVKAVQNSEHAVRNSAEQPAPQARTKTKGAVTGCGSDTLQDRPKSINEDDLDSVEAKRFELSTLALRTPRSPN